MSDIEKPDEPAEEPVVEPSAAEGPAAEEPAAEEPSAAEEPAAEEPAGEPAGEPGSVSPAPKPLVGAAARRAAKSRSKPPKVESGTAAKAETTTIAGTLTRQTKGYSRRIYVIYGILVAVAVGAVAGVVVFQLKPSLGAAGPSWSSWKPAHGTTAQMATAIADHVAREYKLNKSGAPLVAVVAGPPQVTSGTHKIIVSNIAVKRMPKSDAGIQILPSGKTWVDQLCGIGSTSCSIPSGTPSLIRGRLVRREALEVALYTFKFVPAINSIIAFMPPPSGQPPTTALYLQKADLTRELSQPLAKTLPLATPPLPTDPDTKEAATIDKLTLPAVYQYNYQQLQDASALLVLNPQQT
jgi:hypothetical protein